MRWPPPVGISIELVDLQPTVNSLFCPLSFGFVIFDWRYDGGKGFRSPSIVGQHSLAIQFKMTATMQKLGRYDLIRVLGKGAMGLVYEARDPNLNRRVAIKTIRVEDLSDEEATDYEIRFRTEAHSAARLHHPHIVSVFDSDREIEIAYLVMEFVDGDDLKQHLDRGEVYTLAQTLGLMGDLLSALDYAHRQGVVHRDIKPANLLLEPSGRLKLTDFGVARIQDSADATRTQGTMVGTLKYMSPEQVQGGPIDARSDLFAAGVVLYQLLTSKRPFDGATDFDIIQNIIGHTPTLPSTITHGLPAELDAVVMRALEKRRENRYASAQEFHSALVAAVHADTDQTIAPQASTVRGRSRSTRLALDIPPFVVAADSSSGSSASSVVAQEVELVYWKDIKDSDEADDFEEFLRKFPKGIYADLARKKLKRVGTFSATLMVPRDSSFAGNDDQTVVTPGTTKPPRASKIWGLAVVTAAVLGGAYWGFFGSARPDAAVSGPQADASARAAQPEEVFLDSVVPARAPSAGKSIAADTVRKPKAQSTTANNATPTAPVVGEKKSPSLADPRTTCEGRWLLSYQICMSSECAKPALAQLPICRERHEQERKNQERDQLR